jgi:hypothetical protein
MMGGFAPHPPGFIAVSARMDVFLFAGFAKFVL